MSVLSSIPTPGKSGRNTLYSVVQHENTVYISGKPTFGCNPWRARKSDKSTNITDPHDSAALGHGDVARVAWTMRRRWGLRAALVGLVEVGTVAHFRRDHAVARGARLRAEDIGAARLIACTRRVTALLALSLCLPLARLHTGDAWFTVTILPYPLGSATILFAEELA